MPDALIEQDPYHWFNPQVRTLLGYLEEVEKLEKKGESISNPAAKKVNLTHRKLLLEVYLKKLDDSIRIMEAHEAAFKRAHPIYPPKAEVSKDGADSVKFDFYTWKRAVEEELEKTIRELEA